MTKFVAKNSRDEDVEVTYSQIELASGGASAILNFSWSVSNFGFGDFCCFKKSSIAEVVLDNEYVSRNIVREVVACGFYNLINVVSDRFNKTEEDLTYDMVREEFKTKPGDFRVFYAIDDFTTFKVVEGDKEFYAFRYEFGCGLKKYIVELKKYPEFDATDDAHFNFSNLLNDGNWSNYFISTRRITYEIIRGDDFIDADEIEDASIIRNDDSKKVFLLYKMSSHDRHQFSHLMTCEESGYVKIANFPYSRETLAKIGYHIADKIRMTDEF